MVTIRKIRVQLILCSVIAFIVLQYVVFLPYLIGLQNSTALFELTAISVIPAVLLAFACLIYQTYMVFTKWRACPTHLFMIRLGIVAMSALIFVVIIASYYTWPPLHTAGFKRRLNSINLREELTAIRQWLAEVEKPTKSDPYPHHIRWSDRPAPIRRIGGFYVWLVPCDDDEKTWQVTVESGGRPGRWGVVIGPEDMEIPKGTLPLGPGAYIYPLTR